MTALFSPYKIGNIELKNRIVMSPMCMYSSHNEDGMVENWHRTHYVSRAVGGTGLIMLEATAVTAQGRISSRDLGIWSDDHISGLSDLVSQIHEQGAHATIQLAHAGRKATVDGPIIAPSAIPYNEKMKTPEEMTKEDISETIRAFKEGARRTKEAGFDIIELHAAHGYLINEFLSPLSNRREDEYGGSMENRFRFLRDIMRAVKEVWNGPLMVRISASDYHEEGNDISDYAVMAAWMKDEGAGLIDCSSGAVVPAQINVYPGYQVKFAETIKKEAGIASGAVGMITSGLQAEEILQNERADLIFIGRALLDDPYWPLRAARELQTEFTPPVQYERGWK
ncbi:NADPH dehydrogenase NamA [Bacillus marinisedimentorum]|uniref:NADPH dehydrogenase NamA n=1 Tax=Bacillus marinisedimentorum TaxID=1821260 RepID=UPI000871E16C|nr:NADPH dehydrogenase NamA [Bacillus marinisedimentorum]